MPFFFLQNIIVVKTNYDMINDSYENMDNVIKVIVF